MLAPAARMYHAALSFSPGRKEPGEGGGGRLHCSDAMPVPSALEGTSCHGRATRASAQHPCGGALD